MGRKLEHTIILDDKDSNYNTYTPNNGIQVQFWEGDMEDKELPILKEFLKELVEEEVEDVRKFLTDEIKQEIIYVSLGNV